MTKELDDLKQITNALFTLVANKIYSQFSETKTTIKESEIIEEVAHTILEIALTVNYAFMKAKESNATPERALDATKYSILEAINNIEGVSKDEN